MTDRTSLPTTQHAIQLVGPGQLRLVGDKPVAPPAGRQILMRVECVGLCFSDMKLLKQFADHPRKAPIVSGIDPEILASIPSYVPGDKPVVPGHEIVGTIVAVGPEVAHHQVGERCLAQTDYRDLRTPGSNAACGYNFEGALQEYVLMDERVVIDARGDRYLIPAPADFGASSIALVEPWACVEHSYVTRERQTIKPGGRLLIVAEPGRTIRGIEAAFAAEGRPAAISAIAPDRAQRETIDGFEIPVSHLEFVSALPDEGFDDIVYFGAKKETLEILNDKLAAGSILNIVLGGEMIGAPVSVGVGRIHYGPTRWIGTPTDRADDAYRIIPETGEIAAGDRILIAGAGGPMGQMHAIRCVASGLENLRVVATDFDDARLDSLGAKLRPLAGRLGVGIDLGNARTDAPAGPFDYIALMAPAGALVADAIRDAGPGCRVNIFAGIPAPTRHALDLDRMIAERVFLFGTSGSAIRDMRLVLGKVTGRQLDTDLSVDAVSGMAGAIDGLAAVEARTLAGKIVVYPALHDLPLTPLATLAETHPAVAAKLDHGHWCQAAEAELLRDAGAV